MKAIIAIVLLAVISLIALFAMSSNTVLTINPEVKTVGVTTPVTVKISNPHVVRRTASYIEQGGARFPLTEVKTPAHRFFWRRNQAPETLTFDAGKSKAPNLKEGDARIVVEADSDDLAGHTDATSFAVKVVLAPPRVAPDDAQHYINQGGMELAVMTPGGSWSEAGVKVGKYTFRSFPLPGHPEQRFAMFAYPWDLADNVTPMVFARNLAGTEATAQFWFKLFPKKFRTRDFPIDDALVSKMVNQIDPGGTLAPGPDMLSRFLKINGEMRRQNNRQLADLRLKTEEKILWNGPFLHWGKEESLFADVRNYLYQGKQVDRQVHLLTLVQVIAHVGEQRLFLAPVQERPVPQNLLFGLQAQVRELPIVLAPHLPIDLEESREHIGTGRQCAAGVDLIDHLRHQRVIDRKIARPELFRKQFEPELRRGLRAGQVAREHHGRHVVRQVPGVGEHGEALRGMPR